MKRLLYILVSIQTFTVTAVDLESMPGGVRQPSPTQFPPKATSALQALFSQLASESIADINKDIKQILPVLNNLSDFFDSFELVLQESADMRQKNLNFYQNYLQLKKGQARRASTGSGAYNSMMVENLQPLYDTYNKLLGEFSNTSKAAYNKADVVLNGLPSLIGGLSMPRQHFLNLIIQKLQESLSQKTQATTSITQQMENANTLAG